MSASMIVNGAGGKKGASVSSEIRRNILEAVGGDRPYHPKNPAEIKLYVGIDYSIRSPAIVTYFVGSNVYNHWFLPRRKREKSLCFELNNDINKKPTGLFSFRAIEDPPVLDKEQNRVQWYWDLAQACIKLIRDECERGNVKANEVHVGIEGYAFRQLNSSSFSKLCEAGGILRGLLLEANYHFVEIPPDVVKRTFVCKGGTTKLDMFHAWQERLALPDPSLQLGFKSTVECIDGDSNEEEGANEIDELTGMPVNLEAKKKVPNPLEDLVDSFGVLMCCCPHVEESYGGPIDIVLEKKKKRGKKSLASKKRKRSDSKSNDQIVLD